MRKVFKSLGRCVGTGRRRSSDGDGDPQPQAPRSPPLRRAEPEIDPDTFLPIKYPSFPPPIPHPEMEKDLSKMSEEMKNSLWRLFWHQNVWDQEDCFINCPNLYYKLKEESGDHVDCIRNPQTGENVATLLSFAIPDLFPDYTPENLYLNWFEWVEAEEGALRLYRKGRKNFHFRAGPQRTEDRQKFDIEKWRTIQTYLPDRVEPKEDPIPQGNIRYFNEGQYLEHVFQEHMEESLLEQFEELKKIRQSDQVDQHCLMVQSNCIDEFIPDIDQFREMLKITPGTFEDKYLQSITERYTRKAAVVRRMHEDDQSELYVDLNKEVMDFIIELQNAVPKIQYLTQKYNCSIDEASDIYWEKKWNEKFSVQSPMERQAAHSFGSNY